MFNSKDITIFFITAISIIIIDQYIKVLFIDGAFWYSKCIEFTFALNKGVAFSMFAFLGENLKYIQIVMIFLVIIYLYFEEEMLSKYPLPLGLVIGAGFGNIYDRFTEGGVVDYIYWHCGFDFAIFNFADIMIDLGVILIIILSIMEWRKEKKS